jgi:hypothetical protein
VAASSRPPDQTGVIHHRADELLVEWHTVSDGQVICPVKGMLESGGLHRVAGREG